MQQVEYLICWTWQEHPSSMAPKATPTVLPAVMGKSLKLAFLGPQNDQTKSLPSLLSSVIKFWTLKTRLFVPIVDVHQEYSKIKCHKNYLKNLRKTPNNLPSNGWDKEAASSPGSPDAILVVPNASKPGRLRSTYLATVQQRSRYRETG